MLAEVVDRLRLAVALEVARGRVGVVVHGEEPPPDQVGLGGLAQAQPDVGLAHAEVELLVGEDHLQLDVGVEVEELAQARRQPARAERESGGDAQVAVRLLAAVGEVAPDRVELQHHVLDGAEQQLPLFGQDQPPRVAVEQRRFEFGFERADLAAHGRLAEVQDLARVGEGPRIGGRLEDPQLVPIHRRLPHGRTPCRAAGGAAKRRQDTTIHASGARRHRG